jgi:hypothetical protein
MRGRHLIDHSTAALSRKSWIKYGRERRRGLKFNKPDIKKRKDTRKQNAKPAEQ